MTRLLIGVSLATAVLASAGAARAADAPSGPLAACTQCHSRLPDGGLDRISQIRKTPEGWQATLTRMGQLHGLKLSEAERDAAVKYLADSQGLAPAETSRYRHALERVPNQTEVESDPELVTNCARCHSFARVALERRDAGEWTKLAHFHAGQFPTAEYHLLARDKPWWEIISTRLPKVLGKKYPYSTKEWTAWKAAAKTVPTGTWLVYGYQPGIGAYGGTLTVAAGDAADRYASSFDLKRADGSALNGQGKSILYTGYEWRGSSTLGGADIREVLALSADGRSLAGRWFNAGADEIGGTLRAVRADAPPQILGFSRTAIRAGETATVTIWGAGLEGDASFGPGVIAKPVATGPGFVTLEVTAARNAKVGARTAAIGKAKATEPFTVYRSIDSVKVEPPLAIARIGGNGGKAPQVQAPLEAIAYANGPDGKPGTKDDIRLGTFPATWTTAPFNAEAEKMEDVKFAGGLTASGLFQPAGAGPNPQRHWGTNNVGDLKVTATVDDQGRAVEGTGRVISTVQRFIDPAIR